MNQTGRHWTEQAQRRLADAMHALDAAVGYTSDPIRLTVLYRLINETRDLYDKLERYRSGDQHEV